MTNNFIVNVENKLQGIGTRLKELHWGSPSYSIHKIIDEFQEEFGEFEDSFIENSSALWGFINVGELEPVLPEARDFETLLEDLRGIVIGVKKRADDDLMWTGIINLIDDFVTEINKYIYLVRIAKHEAE